jgi:hypothetical protein
MNASNPYRAEGAQVASGVPGATVAACTLADYDTDGTLINCAAGRKPVGVFRAGYTDADAEASIGIGGKQLVKTDSSGAIGDYLKSTTAGVAIKHSSTTFDASVCFGVQTSVADADGYAEARFIG